MLIKMHLITLFRVMNSHQRCLQAKVKYRNEPKQVMPTYSMGSNNCGDIIIAVRCTIIRKLIAAHGIIASVVQMIKNINCGGTSRFLNNCGAVHLMRWLTLKSKMTANDLSNIKFV